MYIGGWVYAVQAVLIPGLPRLSIHVHVHCMLYIPRCVCVQVYALVTSEQSVMTEIVHQEVDGSDSMQPLDRDPLFVPPLVDHFHLQLFSPACWEMVPDTK